jgi:hypothetical protein
MLEKIQIVKYNLLIRRKRNYGGEGKEERASKNGGQYN